MAILEYVMNIQTVISKGKKLEELGNELHDLIKRCDATMEELAAQGMVGTVRDRMSSVYKIVQPSMLNETVSIGELGVATQKVAINTDDMANTVANALAVNNQANMKDKYRAIALTSVKNVKPIVVEESDDVNTGRAGVIDSVDKMLKNVIKMKENLKKNMGLRIMK